jgi:predicted phosphoribosyltransferase
MEALLRDRAQAGRFLAGKLRSLAGRDDLVVLALPRGGVPVGFEVARALDAPLDVFLVRKLGVPGFDELALGAIASGGVRVLNPDVVLELDIPADVIDAVAKVEGDELARRERIYRRGHPAVDVRDRCAILVDDGLATGSTMCAAVTALRKRGPVHVVAAVPIGAAASCAGLEPLVDRLVCAASPEPFDGIGRWYERFSQTTDAEVVELLEKSRDHAKPRERAP